MSANVSSSWSSGYVTEVDYTIGFYRELAPSYLNWAAIQRGCHPPAIDQPFTALELGCGHGYSTNVLAACNPEGTFYATDFNPAHVFSARQLATEAGTKNVTFFEDSFGELKNRDLPDFDYISLHGVYSWITPENRREIVEIINRKLKPGGIAYVSYNSWPGWAAMAPAQRLITQYAVALNAPLMDKMDQSLALLEQLKESGASYFGANPSLAPRLETLKKQNRSYLVHEYFNECWEPMYHADVVAEMTEAKLKFIASATYAENLDRIAFPGKTREIYDQMSDPVMKETVRDFATNQQFRRDLFMRGRIEASHRERVAYYEKTPFALIQPIEKCKMEQQVPAGKLSLKPETYKPLLSVLAQGPKTIPELLQQPELAQHTFANMVDNIHLCGAFGYVHPCRPVACKSRNVAVSRSFNQAILRRGLAGQQLSTLASPVLGSGFNLGLVDQVFLLAHQQQQKDPVAFVWSKLKQLGKKLVHEGKTLEGDTENLQHLQELNEIFARDVLPICRQIALL